MVRLYAIMNTGYDDMCYYPEAISLSPISDFNCWYIDLEEKIQYPSVVDLDEPDDDWKPYNASVFIGEFIVNTETGEELEYPVETSIINGEEIVIVLTNGDKIYLERPEWDDWVDGNFKYQRYQNGEPVGEPYFA